jgi:hypothetical protein
MAFAFLSLTILAVNFVLSAISLSGVVEERQL